MENNVATFCKCCFEAHVFVERFCHIFSFCRHGHIFQRKLVLSFSLTHKLFKFYVYEVASIFMHSGVVVVGGGEIIFPPPHSRN